MTNAIRRIVDSSQFQWSVLVLILCAAILVGVETYPSVVTRHGQSIRVLNNLILWAFVIEAALKMGQHGFRFLRYFRDPWNIFDFAIIAVCFLPLNAQYAAVLRLARVFRSLRLVTALPKLQLLVNALLKSIPSMFYVGVMLVLLFYVYGVMGVFLFRDNDPVHFYNLPTSMLTLFRVVTQEDWTDVMYIQMYGSDVYPYENTTDFQPKPMARPVFSALFFVSFVFIGTMILLNLFIGVILNSMEEVQKERDASLAKPLADDTTDGSPEASVDQQLAHIQQQLQAIRQRLS